MNIDNLCISCFSVINNKGEKCINCTEKEVQDDFNLFYLKSKTVLCEKYVVGKVIGHGGFGITYIGYDKTKQERIAIKEYYPQNFATRYPGNKKVFVQFGKTEEAFKRWENKFLEEARMLSLMNNIDGVVSVHDFFYENSTSYMVMEYIEGYSFKQYIEKKGGKISFEECCQLLAPVMKALAEVHKKNLLHRDITPENIMLDKNCHAKLIDFGAARYKINQVNNTLSVILKEGFAPEEQYRAKGEQGPWTDIYSFGATIYYAITGEEPVDALERGEKDILIPPSKKGISIKKDQERVLMKALAVKAKDRYQNMYEMLERIVNDAGFTKSVLKEIKNHVTEPSLLRSDIVPFSDTNMPIENTEATNKMKMAFYGFSIIIALIVIYIMMK